MSARMAQHLHPIPCFAIGYQSSITLPAGAFTEHVHKFHNEYTLYSRMLLEGLHLEICFLKLYSLRKLLLVKNGGIAKKKSSVSCIKIIVYLHLSLLF